MGRCTCSSPPGQMGAPSKLAWAGVLKFSIFPLWIVFTPKNPAQAKLGRGTRAAVPRISFPNPYGPCTPG